MNLTRNISLEELTTSQTATRLKINNTPTPEIIENLKVVAAQVQKVRDHFGKPLIISSGYRSEKLNSAIGGARNSQHTKGEAIDIQSTNGYTNADIFNYIKNNLDFDQLIWEYGTRKEPKWVHISYKKSGNRKQILYVGV
jgi:hypothetical protein